MNTKGRVQTLKENKIILLVLSRELETALAQCTADCDLYGIGLADHKFFRQTVDSI